MQARRLRGRARLGRRRSARPSRAGAAPSAAAATGAPASRSPHRRVSVRCAALKAISACLGIWAGPQASKPCLLTGTLLRPPFAVLLSSRTSYQGQVTSFTGDRQATNGTQRSVAQRAARGRPRALQRPAAARARKRLRSLGCARSLSCVLPRPWESTGATPF